MLIIRGGINSKKRELCPTALALSAFYYNKNKHADTYIMYLHAYSTSGTTAFEHGTAHAYRLGAFQLIEERLDAFPLQLHNHTDSDGYMCTCRFSVLPLLL